MKHIKGRGIVDAHGNKIMSKRQADLALARSYGREGKLDQFTTLQIHSRVARIHLLAAYREGAQS